MRPDRIVTAGDVLVFVLLLAATGAGVMMVSRSRPVGEEAVIEVNGVLREKLALSVDRVLRIDSPYGFNTVEVSGGRIRVREASCSNKICAAQGWIHRETEEIVCLPNRFNVRVAGRGGEKYDGITR